MKLNKLSLIPQNHYKLYFLSTWATKSCSGFCHVRNFTYLSVANKKTSKTLIWHGKDSNKIRETHSFWRNISNYGAIWLQTLICNRLNPWFEMQAVWLSIQRNHPLDFIRPFLAMTIPEQAHHCSSGLTKPFANERLLLWRLMYWGCNYSFDEPSLASPDTSHL